MSSGTLDPPSSTVPVGRPGVRAFFKAHPVLIDIAIAAAYVLVMLPGLLHSLIFSDGLSMMQAGIGLAATLGAGIALLFRRRAPIIVLAVVLVLMLVVKTLLCALSDPLGLAIAGYAVGAYLPQRRAWITVTAATFLIVLIILIGTQLSTETLGADALLILNLVLFVPACLIGLLVNMLSRLREAEELRVMHEMQERVQAAELMAAQERTVLSREMHDVVGHSLTAIINLSDGVLRASTVNPEVLEAGLRRTNAIARDALGETRAILGTLRTEGEAAPRSPAQMSTQAKNASAAALEDAEFGIRELLDTAESTGLSTHFVVDGEPVPGSLSDEVRGAVYRIVQEAITNTMRHADDATQVTVSLVHFPKSLMVQVQDNGQPVSAPPVGNGIRGARERAVQLGGELLSGPGAAGGWRVTATIPTSQEVNS